METPARGVDDVAATTIVTLESGNESFIERFQCE
jgi:hypothetical protein